MPLCVCDTSLIFLSLCEEWKPYFILLYLHNHNNTSRSLHSVYEIFQVCPKPPKIHEGQKFARFTRTHHDKIPSWLRFTLYILPQQTKNRSETVKRGVKSPRQGNVLLHYVRVRLCWCESESESDIASRWVQRETNLMFTLSSDKDRSKNSLSRSLSLSVNEPLLLCNSSTVCGSQCLWTQTFVFPTLILSHCVEICNTTDCCQNAVARTYILINKYYLRPLFLCEWDKKELKKKPHEVKSEFQKPKVVFLLSRK